MELKDPTVMTDSWPRIRGVIVYMLPALCLRLHTHAVSLGADLECYGDSVRAAAFFFAGEEFWRKRGGHLGLIEMYI